MQSGESIYNLIPQPEVVPARPPMHKSKHPGEVDPRDFGMGAKRENATLGRSPGSLKPDTSEFLRKKNPEDTLRSLSSTARRREKSMTKPAVPKATERPVMGLVSQKNFVKANAIENILAKPPKREEPLRATQKRDYGKVPKYLQTIKSQIAAEREIIAEYHRQQEEAEHGTARAMSEEERDELLVELKMKWAKLNRAYGGLPFSLDVPSHQRKKEQLEHEMTQLEKDIKTLQGRQVVVVEDGQLK